MPTAKKTIHAKLIAARKTFHSTEIKKTGWNDYSKYWYFELSDFLVPAMNILADNDLIPIMSFTDVLATMTVYDVTGDATIVITSDLSTATLKACQPVQSMGACQTFVTRYCYQALLQICEHPDEIEQATGKPEPAKAVRTPDAPVPAKQVRMPEDTQWAKLQEYIEAGQIPPKTIEWLQKDDAANWNALTYSKMTKVLSACKNYKGEN